MSDDVTIDLNRLWRAIRSGDRWILQRRQPSGAYDTEYMWRGPRHSIYAAMSMRAIVPSNFAEAILARLPENRGFKTDEELRA